MAKTSSQKTAPLQLKIRIPHVLIDARGADPKLLEALAPGLQELDARVRILGENVETLPCVFSMEEALEESHICVVLSKKKPHDFELFIERGIVPVMLETLHPKANNYNPSKETGNAFLFTQLNAWHVYGAIVRALENFSFPYDWESLRKHGKELL